jgi:hypothetical protein
MSSGPLYRVALFRTEVSVNVLSAYSSVSMLISFHSFVTMETLLLLIKPKEHCFWDAFTAIYVTHVYWGFVPCSIISNRRFGECTLSMFSGSYIVCSSILFHSAYISSRWALPWRTFPRIQGATQYHIHEDIFD